MQAFCLNTARLSVPHTQQKKKKKKIAQCLGLIANPTAKRNLQEFLDNILCYRISSLSFLNDLNSFDLFSFSICFFFERSIYTWRNSIRWFYNFWMLFRLF